MPLSTCQAQEEMVKDPHARIQTLSEIGAAVEIDDNIPPRRYFRSGLEMMRMANVYYEEKNLENAFILYSKFITLFLEKLPHHQDYQLVPASDKKNMKKKIKEIFPKAEKIKELLRERYNQETLLLQQQKKKEMARHALEREQRNREQDEQMRLEQERQKYEEEKELRLSQQREKQLMKEITNPHDAQITFSNNIDWPSLPEFDGSSCSSDVPSLSTGATDYETIPEISIAAKPNVDRTTKPPSLLSHTATQPELHNVVVPASLMPKFLNLAQGNTEKAVETCGVLAGRLSHNVFTITHLLIPHQHGTSDSCTTENEEAIFDYQDQHDLLTLGWIHTHPTQTSFMSSVDLHTHCSYQLMMPEAIAINWNFTLTQDFGLDYIAKCQQTGFHPHPKEPALYETCSHVITDCAVPVVVVDLRSS